MVIHNNILNLAQGHLANKKLANKNFQIGFLDARGGFLSYATTNLLNLKRIRDLNLKNNLVIIKRER